MYINPADIDKVRLETKVVPYGWIKSHRDVVREFENEGWETKMTMDAIGSSFLEFVNDMVRDGECVNIPKIGNIRSMTPNYVIEAMVNDKYHPDNLDDFIKRKRELKTIIVKEFENDSVFQRRMKAAKATLGRVKGYNPQRIDGELLDLKVYSVINMMPIGDDDSSTGK